MRLHGRKAHRVGHFANHAFIQMPLKREDGF